MADMPVLHIDTRLARGLHESLRQLEQRLDLTQAMRLYLAGSMAVWRYGGTLYTAARVTTDVDAEFSRRVAVPGDLIVDVTLEDGSVQPLYFDTNYNASFALLHEDYLDDALPVPWHLPHIELRVLSPVNLAVSKIARLADNDRDDIQALVRRGLTTADAIEQRASAALAGFVGGLAMLRFNLRDALVLARAAERSPLV